jgi:hypothetical protein
MNALLRCSIFGFFCHLSLSISAAWEPPLGWTDTVGGEDGVTVCVTTLAADGPGSLAEALATQGQRIIEFSVGGIIDLGGRSLSLREPFVTIAGETAPSPGITLINGGISVMAHDVIIRHLRIRPGAGGRPRASGWEVDGLATGAGAYDVIVDHCSFSWATDENLSASGPRFEGATPDDWRRNTSHRITFSHNIVAEGLHDATHSYGPHSKGSLIHDNATDILIFGNLYISNDDRNPHFKGGARGAIINNVMHNPGHRFLQFALNIREWEGHPIQRGVMVIVGNVARVGPSTAVGIYLLDARGPLDFYLNDNLYLGLDGSPAAGSLRLVPNVEMSADMIQDALTPIQVDEPPIWPAGLMARPAAEVHEWVLATAGARPWDRDAVDLRLVAEAREGRGRIIHSESEVGGLLAR